MTANSDRDKRRILADPVAAFLERKPYSPSEFFEALRQLCSRYEELQQQHREKQVVTRRLSREIGAAKRSGKALDSLLASIQIHNAELKAVAARRQQVESEILEYFADEATAARESPIETGWPAPRYPSAAAQAQDTVITRLDNELDLWNTYVASHPAASIYHRAEWRQLIKQTFGHECPYFLAQDRDGNVVGVLPLVHLHSRLFGNFMISMPYFNYGGAIADHPEIEKRLMEAANS